jgi:hypothetical protein
MEKFNEMKELVASLEEDAAKFFNKDNKSAGVRLRKGLQDIKALAQQIRVEVSEKNKNG